MNETPAPNSPAQPDAAKPGTVGPAAIMLQKLMSAISRAIYGSPGEVPETRLTGVWKSVQECIASQWILPCDAESLQKLRDWDAEHAKLEKIIETHSGAAALAYWQQHRIDHLDSVAAAGTSLDVLSRQEVEERFLRTSNDAKEREVQLYKANIPTARAIAAGVAEIVAKQVSDIIESEKTLHARWGVPYTPSAIVQQLRRAEKQVMAVVAADASPIGPRSIFPYLPL